MTLSENPAPKLSKAAQKMWTSTHLPPSAIVSGFNGDARIGNGQYREQARAGGNGTPFFKKVGGGAFIYRLGLERWCIGAELDGQDSVWAEKLTFEATLPRCRKEPWDLVDGKGKPEVTVLRCMVHLIGASGLRSADLNNLSDPYVLCEVREKPHLKFKSRVVRRQLNPFWQEWHNIDGVELGDNLCLSVFDWDFDSDHDFLGEGKVQIIPNGFRGELGLTLRGRKAGCLRIEVHLPPIITDQKKAGKKLTQFDVNNPKALVLSLQDGGEEALRAVTAMESMVTSGEIGSRFVAAGAVQPLVALLAEVTSEARIRVISALHLLAGSAVGQRCIYNAGGLPGLLEILHSSSLKGKEEAAGVLLQLSGIDAVCHALVASDALPIFVSLLTTACTSDGVAHAARTLALIGSKPPFAALIIQLNALPALVKLLEHENPFVTQQASFALASIANTDEHRRLVLEARAVPAMVGLIGEGSPDGRKQAAATIAALASADDEQLGWIELQKRVRQLADEGVIPALVELLSYPHDECTEQATLALCKLAANPQAAEIILYTGVVPPLLNLIKLPSSMKGSTKLLQALAQYPTLRGLIKAAVPENRGHDLVFRILEDSRESPIDFRRVRPLRRVLSGAKIGTITPRADATPAMHQTMTTLSTTRSVGSLLPASQTWSGPMTPSQRSPFKSSGRIGWGESPGDMLDLGVDLRFVPIGATVMAGSRKLGTT